MSGEVKFIAIGLLFFLAFGLIVQAVTGSEVTDDTASKIAEVQAEQGTLSAMAFNFAVGVFGIFNVNISYGLAIMPSFVSVFLTLYATILIIIFVLYVITAIGQIVPFT